MTKDEARKAAYAARAEAAKAGQGRAAEILGDFLADKKGRILSGYMPMRNEVDPLPAMKAHEGIVCVPIIPGKGVPLEFRQWTPDSKMIEGAFKALIPENGAVVEPEVLIVPLLSFDARGYRLGYGGGYYDRTLEMLRAKRPTLAIGYAFAAQEVPEVPTEPTDQKLDLIITEKGLRWFGQPG